VLGQLRDDKSGLVFHHHLEALAEEQIAFTRSDLSIGEAWESWSARSGAEHVEVTLTRSRLVDLLSMEAI
jgi:hypothetical protein